MSNSTERVVIVGPGDTVESLTAKLLAEPGAIIDLETQPLSPRYDRNLVPDAELMVAIKAHKEQPQIDAPKRRGKKRGQHGGAFGRNRA